jgi:type II secretory pathway component GspD/PulD (secretin)
MCQALALATSWFPVLLGEDVAKQKEPDWRTHIDAQLEKRVSFDFVDTPLNDVVAFLANLTDSTILLDPKATTGKAAITLKVSDMKLSQALGWVARQAKLEYSIQNGAIFISTKSRIAGGAMSTPKPSSAELREKLDKRVSFDFVDTPLEDVVAYFSQLAGMNIGLHPEIKPKTAKITMKVKDMKMADVFGWLTRLNGLAYRIEGDNAIYITKRVAPK